jgi:dihydroxyacetone kinase-like protein
MNRTYVGAAELQHMLDAGFSEVIQNHAQLTELDSVTGDGDHGITMLQAGESIRVLLRQPAESIAALLSEVGDLLLSNDGGASSALLSSFFLGMADACADKRELDRADLSSVFNAGLRQLQRYTEAKAGDKTMLDAREPALVALEFAQDGSGGIEAAMASAAGAARDGARQTSEMPGRFGRAQHLGNRTIGWQDPGATTIALLFRGFEKGLKQ